MLWGDSLYPALI
ncbi:dicB family protein, partial [Escherichia coli 3.4870]